MAFSPTVNLNFSLGALQRSPLSSHSYPNQRQAMMAVLLSLASLMQELTQGGCIQGMGGPSFGDFQAGTAQGLGGRGFGGCETGPGLAPSFDNFLGGSLLPSRACPARTGGPTGPDCRSGRLEDRARPAASSPTRESETAAPVSRGDGRDQLGEIDVERLVQALPASRRESARTHFPIIIAEARRQGVPSRAQLAYILATATHESGAGRRMVEIASGEAYEGRRGLGNTEPGDGPRYRGRGYVQLTGRSNYTAWSRRLGMDLVGNPSLAERPEVAARILVGGMCGGTFTRHRLDRYVNDDLIDFDGARRTIGSGRGAERVSAVARQLLAAMS